jgi:hypothetical protein
MEVGFRSPPPTATISRPAVESVASVNRRISYRSSSFSPPTTITGSTDKR